MKALIRSAPLWLALALGGGAAGAAPSDALLAADPATPAPARHRAEPPSLPEPQRLDPPEPPGDLAQALAAWREANARVADFPRGHADLLRWEQAQAAPAAPTPPAQAAPIDHHTALRDSLRERPELFTHAGMNALERAQVRVAYAAHVRTLSQAWTEAVAQAERERLARAVLAATRAGSELGRRMLRAGNWPAARLMQEQLHEAQAWRAASEAALAAHSAVERLAREMGLWRADEVEALAQRLPPTLAPLPATLDGPGPHAAEAAALAAWPRLGLEREQTARSLRALGAERWAAWDSARDSALAALPAPTPGAAEPPQLTDFRLQTDARLREADTARAALLRAAAERRSLAREAWRQRQASHALAQHAERVSTELRAGLLQDSQLRHNGMLDSTWQLLASAREHSAALDAAIAARRDFWLSEARWQALLAGATPESTP